MSDIPVMDSFKSLVTSCRKNGGNDTLINNAEWDHAMFLISNLLQVAAERNAHVRIVTGSFRKEFFCDNRILKCFDELIEKEIPISVIVVGDPELEIEKHECANKIKAYPKGTFIVSHTPITVPHMILIGDDARAFRYETDHSQTKAVASFNNPKMGSMLMPLFEMARSLATKELVKRTAVAKEAAVA